MKRPAREAWAFGRGRERREGDLPRSDDRVALAGVVGFAAHNTERRAVHLGAVAGPGEGLRKRNLADRFELGMSGAREHARAMHAAAMERRPLEEGP
jgi:hypothetical protein